MSTAAHITRVEVCCLDRVNVPNASRSLTQLGITVNPNTKLLSFLNVGNFDIHVRSDGQNATANDYQLLATGGTTLRIGASSAANLRFFCANVAGSNMNVQQMGDE